MNDALFAQLSTLGASLVLLFGIILLWRRSLHAYVVAFRWQSAVLAAMFVMVGYFGADPELYFVATFFVVVKVIVIPRYLDRLEKQVGAERESQPYVNIATSLIVELGVFLDVLMGFLVMQVFIYHIHGTFESIDVEQLNQLKD